LDWLDALRSQLVDGLEDLFSEPLRKEELHLTLHDLSIPSSDDNLQWARRILPRLSPGEVKMDVVTVFPCLNISVLVGFCAISPMHHARLMDWHRSFDLVVQLSYWYRPHVTLAYFRPRIYTEAEVARLRQRLSSLDIGGTLTLDTSRLFYQRFTDMNHFRDLVGISG
jgi:2'-5' RNA ligase